MFLTIEMSIRALRCLWLGRIVEVFVSAYVYDIMVAAIFYSSTDSLGAIKESIEVIAARLAFTIRADS